MHLWLFGAGYNTVIENDEPMGISVDVKPPDHIAFDGDYGVRMFIFENGKWVEIENAVNYGDFLHKVAIVPMEGSLDREGFVSLVPKYPNLKQRTPLRIVLIGKMVRDGNVTEEKTAGYIDLILTPSRVDWIVSDFISNNGGRLSSYFNILCFLVLWAVLVKKSFSMKTKFPWEFAVILFGLIFLRSILTLFENIEIPIVLVFVGCFLFLKRRDLNNYFINPSNLLPGALIGTVLGTGFFLVYFLLPFEKYQIPQQVISNFNPWLVIPTSIGLSIAEELLFRSFLLGSLIQNGVPRPYANLIQGALFVVAHFSRYLFTGLWFDLLNVALFGFTAGFITLKHKNIVGAIFLHTLINLGSLIFVSHLFAK